MKNTAGVAKNIYSKAILLLVTSLVLTACGGSGGGDDSGSTEDTTAPVITLLGATTSSLLVGDTYTDPGATALDNVDGDITGNIVVAGDVVNTAIEGTYVVTYNVSDAAGNQATQLTRTVTVDVITAATRVARLLYDFDNNGIFEGEAQFTYDATGRVILENYVYTDDSAPDTDFRTFTIGGSTENMTTSYSYDANGLLETWVIDQGGDRFTTTYTYSNDRLVTAVNTVFEDNTGAETARITSELSYTGTRLDRYTAVTMILGLPGQGISDTYDLSYDGAGLLASDLMTSVLGAQSEQTYSWRVDGNIDMIQNTNPDPAINFTEIVDFIYDVNNRLITRQVLANDPGDDYKWDMVYDSADRLIEERIDLDSDGSVEAVVQSQWEDGPCAPVFLWTLRAEPNFKADPASLYLPGTGYAVFSICGE